MAAGHTERCTFAHHAPITPPWPSSASESGADRFSRAISEYERAA
jgi:hypothetical protein